MEDSSRVADTPRAKMLREVDALRASIQAEMLENRVQRGNLTGQLEVLNKLALRLERGIVEGV